MSASDGERPEREAQASSALAAALLPFASSPGFIKYGEDLKKSPLDVEALQRQKEIVRAAMQFTA